MSPLPTILVVGATGNTGQGAVRTLSSLLAGKDVRILGLTRSLESAASQALAALPGVEMEAELWSEIDAAWLRTRNVTKAYVAAHNEADQFVDESALYSALLAAGVEYLVRVSTFAPYIAPNSPSFYGRAHWAAETLLQTPEFKPLRWTSLRPNFFAPLFLGNAAEWVKAFRATGKQTPLKLFPDEHAKVAIIDPTEVGVFGAHLLAMDDASAHNQARYILNGPEDVTGRDIVALVERLVGQPIQDVLYNDLGWIHALGDAGVFPPKIIRSFETSMRDYAYKGKGSTDVTQTSREVVDLGLAPKRTAAELLDAMLQ